MIEDGVGVLLVATGKPEQQIGHGTLKRPLLPVPLKRPVKLKLPRRALTSRIPVWTCRISPPNLVA